MHSFKLAQRFFQIKANPRESRAKEDPCFNVQSE